MRETPRIVEGQREEEQARLATRACLGRSRRTILARARESSSDTRTTATLRGHGQSARETVSTNGERHASIAPVSEAPLARLADCEDPTTVFFDPDQGPRIRFRCAIKIKSPPKYKLISVT